MSEVTATGEQDVLLSVEDLAERYGITPETVYKWNSKGIGPPFFKAGGVKYRLSAVRAWEDDKGTGNGTRKAAS